MSLLPVEPAWRLAERAEEHRWLVTGLWGEQAVGIVGGEPKCCKSFLALDLAVAVASGTPCLRRFAVPQAGRVLLFAAEDALHIVRRRLEGICAAAGVALADLDIQVITSPTLRLDLEADRRNLADTVATLQPRLLILDPFVRLHRIDENASGEVAPLLAFLRELQRRHGTAVLVVHHAKKGGGSLRTGQALRGSSEFHAWGDSNLYLGRNGDEIALAVERLAEPAPEGVIECADFRVSQRKCYFRQRQSFVLQEIQCQRFAHVVLKIGIVYTSILQPPLERARRSAGRLGETIHSTFTFDQ
jgi:RecA-family ATPase